MLFGGLDGTFPSDTWEWDGRRWHRLVTSLAPPGRLRHAMAFDWLRDRVVLFGGWNGVNLADTWEWDGSGLTRLQPNSSAMPRSGHAMAYDLVRRKVVLFGGSSSGNQAFGATWEWDGTQWTDASLRGVTVYGQAFVADPQGPVLGLAFTAGRRLSLGD